MGDLCKDVIATYDELKSKGINDFEFVLVTHMRPDFPEFEQDRVVESCFSHFFSSFSCLAVPIFDFPCSRKLLQAMGIYGPYHNRCLILSPDGEVLQNDLLKFRDYGAECYPFTHEQLTELKCRMADISDGVVSLQDILCTTTCNVLSVPDCVISVAQMPLYRIRKKYVWLYLFNDASFFAQLLSMWAQYHEDVEIVLIFPIHADMEYRELIRKTCRQEIMRMLDTLQSRKFRLLECRMSRLLWLFSGRRAFDQLIVVGPWFVDIHGAELSIDYFDQAFSFSKKLLYKNIIERLSSITIEKVTSMLSSSGLDLNGRDVFLYLGTSVKELEWEYHLVERCTEMKRSRPSFQLVFLCLDDKKAAPPDNSWISIPYKHSMSVYNMFESLKFGSTPTVYAYGADGNLVSIRAQQYILDSMDSTSSAPFHDFSYLEEDVAIHLMNTAHYWSELFQPTWKKPVSKWKYYVN